MLLRDYQQELVSEVISCTDNILIQADTGAGKTRILAAIAKKYKYVLLIAHRNALISQLSSEFAKAGLQHNMIAAKKTIRRAELLHRRKIGKSMLSNKSNHFVCSIDTIISKAKRDKLTIDCNNNWLIIVDEAHHMTEENKWGKLCELFINSRIVGATATPSRLDSVSLKKGRGGVFDKLIQAESLKVNSVSILIDRGFLSSFKCYGIKSRLDNDALKIGKHDYTNESLLRETRKHVKKMAGDAVKHYKRLANGKQAVAFCVSIGIAKKTASAFKDHGIASAAIHSNMSRTEIDKIFDLFESRQIQVLCNVDMIGEGVDIPAIEALIMLRKTASLTLYRQWVGRSLRPSTGKDFALIIDHADNIRKHGLPDEHIDWSLDSFPAEKKSNLISCINCGFLIKAWESVCQECGAGQKSKIGYGKEIEYVDAQLVEVYRAKQAQELRDNAIAATVPIDEILNLNDSGSRITELSTKVARWFFENVKDHVTRKQIEDFLRYRNNMMFWASNFKISDLTKPNQKKCLKVFNENQRN